MSLWASYKAISPKTRMAIGLGVMANAALALQFSEQIENLFGLKPSKQDEELLKESIPRVTLIERSDVK